MNTPGSKPMLSATAKNREGLLNEAELRLRDERLDAELEQTFPASDPLPWHHDIDQSARAAVLVDGPHCEKKHEPTAKI